MAMRVKTTDPQQIQEAVLREVLESAWDKIGALEYDIGAAKLYLLVLTVLAKRLEFGKQEPHPGAIPLIPGLSPRQVELVTTLFRKITGDIERFPSEAEREVLYARLLGQIGNAIAQSYQAALKERNSSIA